MRAQGGYLNPTDSSLNCSLNPVLPYPGFNVSASAAFTIIGKMMERCPSDNKLKLRMTRPCGGQYQCLSLFDENRCKHICDFNLLSGRVHVLSPLDDSDGSAIQNWPEERHYLLATLSYHLGLDQVVQDIFRAIGLTPRAEPDPNSGCTERTFGALMARFLHEAPVEVDNGWANERDHAKWLEELPEDCMMTPPYSNDLAGGAWRLQWKGRVVFVDSDIAYLAGTEEAFDLCPAGKNADWSMHVACNRLEQHLRAGTAKADTEREELGTYSINEQRYAAWRIAADYVMRHSQYQLMIEGDSESLRFTPGFFNEHVLELSPLLQSAGQDIPPAEHAREELDPPCTLDDLGWPGHHDFVAAFYNRKSDKDFLDQLDSVTGLQSKPRIAFPGSAYELFLDVVAELFKSMIGSPGSFTVEPSWGGGIEELPKWLQRWPEAFATIANGDDDYKGHAEEAYRVWRIAPLQNESAPFVVVDWGTGRMLSTKTGEVLNYWTDFVRMRVRDVDLVAWILRACDTD